EHLFRLVKLVAHAVSSHQQNAGSAVVLHGSLIGVLLLRLLDLGGQLDDLGMLVKLGIALGENALELRRVIRLSLRPFSQKDREGAIVVAGANVSFFLRSVVISSFMILPTNGRMARKLASWGFSAVL